jgi:hypothetical protein
MLRGEKQRGVCASSGGAMFEALLPAMLLKIQAILATFTRWLDNIKDDMEMV